MRLLIITMVLSLISFSGCACKPTVEVQYVKPDISKFEPAPSFALTSERKDGKVIIKQEDYDAFKEYVRGLKAKYEALRDYILAPP